MGCVGSRKSQNPLEDSLQADLNKCDLEAFQQMFESVKGLLNEADTLRVNLNNTRKQLIRLTFPSDKQNSSLIEAFVIFCWSLSASYEGDIKSSKFEVLNDPPYLKAELSWLDPEQRKFFTLLQYYIKTVLEAPEVLKQQKKNLDQLYRQLESKQREAIRNADKQQIAEIKSNTELNLNNIQTSREKLSGFTKFIENERSYLRGSFASQMKAVVKEADANGKFAAEHNHRSFEKVYQNYEIPVHKYRYTVLSS